VARFDEHPMPSLAWMDCKYLHRERACLRRRICPAGEKEKCVRPCDVCVAGTHRARSEAGHARRQNARAVA